MEESLIVAIVSDRIEPRDNTGRAPDKRCRPMRARARRRPSCAASLSRRSRVARHGRLSIRRLSTAADWVFGDRRFSPQSSLPFVKIKRKKREKRRDPRADRDRSTVSDVARRAISGFLNVRLFAPCRRQCVTSVTYSRLYFAPRENYIALRRSRFFAICVRECDFSSVATEDELVLDYVGETVLRLWSDQFGPARQSTALSTAIVDADVNSGEG